MTITASITTAREFWEQVAQPDYRDFIIDTTDLRKSTHAALSLYHLHEWVFWRLQPTDQQGNTFPSEKEFARHLSQNECSDFALIADVANAQKHFALTRGNPQISTATQVVTRPTGFGEGGYGEGPYGGSPSVVVEIDQNLTDVIYDGKICPFTTFDL